VVCHQIIPVLFTTFEIVTHLQSETLKDETTIITLQHETAVEENMQK
jgi:hypothetical protein